MPGSMPATSQLDWLISMTAMIVLFWSRATRDLLRSFGWGIAALHRLNAATKLPFPRRPPHSVSLGLPQDRRLFRDCPFRLCGTFRSAGEADSFAGGTGGSNPASSSGESANHQFL